MNIRVRMLAFHEVGTFREVNIPGHETFDATQIELLNLTYYYGQNENQSVAGRCSLSVGDVIELKDKYIIIRPTGFAELTAEELAAYEAIPRRDRGFSEYARPLEVDTLAR